MPMIEKDLADAIVELREREALVAGGGYVPIAELIEARCEHLEREQWWRAQMMAQVVT